MRNVACTSTRSRRNELASTSSTGRVSRHPSRDVRTIAGRETRHPVRAAASDPRDAAATADFVGGPAAATRLPAACAVGTTVRDASRTAEVGRGAGT